MTTPIAVALSSDDKYIYAVAVAMWSTLNRTAQRVDVHIIDNGLSDDSRSLTERVAERFPHGNVIFHPIPVSLRSLTDKSPLRGTLARLLIPDLMPDTPRVIYLDADILVLKDIAELYAVDLDDALIGVIKNFRTVEKQYVAHSRFARFYPRTVAAANNERARLIAETGRDDPEHYINAGVFVLNNQAIRAEPEIVHRLADIESASTKRMKDQDWLFHVFAGRMKHLHPRWNCYWSIGRANLWAFEPAERKLYLEARSDPGIIHFVGTNPWEPARPSFGQGSNWRARWRRAAEEMNAALGLAGPLI